MTFAPLNRLLSLSLFALLAAATLTAHADPLKVKTAQGEVQGTLTTDSKVRVFKGIPYAAPPVGNLRWAPPQPPAHFHGTFAASEYGHHCIQTNKFPDMIFHDPGESEDCLSLNVWAPAEALTGKKPEKLPVMVWIYGGGYSAGATSEARQDGQFLAHRNVIIVSMNYRLGIFGFFVHPELAAESTHHASGNYGLLDQAAALAWVKQNIKNFGGDPDNITLFGESAGSFSVSSQMASPLSRGLLAHAIGESGSALTATDGPGDTLEARGQEDVAFAKEAYGTGSLASLRALSTEQIMAGVNNKSIHAPRFWPDVDGYFLPQSVRAIFAAGQQAHIPLLAGWNEDEVRAAVTLAKVQPTSASFVAQAQKTYGDQADAYLALYPHATDEEAVRSAGDIANERFITVGTWMWLEAQVKTGQAPVYRFRFDLPGPGDTYHPKATGAYHSDEIDYVFGTLDQRPGATWRPEDRALTEQMQQYWTDFARTGDPNGPGLPQWPQYKAPDWDVMHLDATSAARPDEQRARYLFLAAHPLPQR